MCLESRVGWKKGGINLEDVSLERESQLLCRVIRGFTKVAKSDLFNGVMAVKLGQEELWHPFGF